MTQAVNIPGIGTVNFPDGMATADIESAIQKNFPQIHNPANTKIPGYTASDTGQFTPIQNAGKQAQAPTGNAALGAGYGAINTLAGGFNAIPKGIAGIAGLVKGAITPGESADNQSQAYMEAAPQIPQIQSGDLNTQAANQAVMGAAAKMASAVPQGLDTAKTFIAQHSPQSASTNPYIESYIRQQGAEQESKQRMGLNIAGNILPMLLTPKGIQSPTKIPEVTPLKTANDLGYSIMPSEAAIKGGSAPIGKLVEGLAGSAKTGVSAVMKNQPITNSLAAADIARTAPDLGITSKTELTPQLLDQARAPNNAVYAQVSKLGRIQTDNTFRSDLNNIGRTPGNSFPGAVDPDIQGLRDIYNVPHFDAADAVLQIRNLRKNATANYKAAAANQVKNAPMLGELADAQQGIADALENQLDRFVGSPADKIGNPKLIQDWRQARKNLAIINTVDNSIKEGTTDVSAEALAKQLNKGAPLSGNLQKIADMQNNFPISIRDVTRVRNKVPINALEGIMGTAGLGSAVLGEPHLGAGLVAGMVARPIARAGLLSRPYQNALLPGVITPFDQILRQQTNPLISGAMIQGNKQ